MKNKKIYRDIFGKKQRNKICRHCLKPIRHDEFYEIVGNEFNCRLCSRLGGN